MELNKILKDAGLKITHKRLMVLEYIALSGKALSLADLEKVFDKKMDRVTIYRTLINLSENKVLTKIANSKGIALFAFDATIDEQNAAHFKCKACDTVDVLPEIPQHYKKMLEDLSIKDFNFTVEGTCKKCS